MPLVSVLLLAGVALAAGTTSYPTTANGTYKEWEQLCTDCEYKGPEEEVTKGTLESCKAQCEARTDCYAIDYGVRDKGKCYLQTGGDLTSYNVYDKYDSYVRREKSFAPTTGAPSTRVPSLAPSAASPSIGDTLAPSPAPTRPPTNVTQTKNQKSILDQAPEALVALCKGNECEVSFIAVVIGLTFLVLSAVVVMVGLRFSRNSKWADKRKTLAGENHWTAKRDASTAAEMDTDGGAVEMRGQEEPTGDTFEI